MPAPLLQLPQKPNYQPVELKSDFFSFFRKLEHRYENVFLLESLGEDTYDSRYAVIGFEPHSILQGSENILQISSNSPGRTESIECENPYLLLRDLIPENILTRNYAGGLVGYIGYDAMSWFEPSLRLQPHPDFPRFILGLYIDGLVYDKMTGEVFYFYYLENRMQIIEDVDLAEDVPMQAQTIFKGYSKTKEEHAAMVNEAIEEIKAGNTFQVQIGFTADYSLKGNPIAVYSALREINPSPYMYYMKFSDRVITGASPELIFRLRQGEMESFPLAGTAPRRDNPEHDRETVRTLLNDPKEIAEHNMLIDLHRNDIGRVARFGTVKVRRAFDIKKFSHVQHISSEVVGIIAHDEDMFTGLVSVYPAGTLSGAPKIESMKIIEKIEKQPRGPYGGAIGHFGFNGDCTFAIPIRTIFIHGSDAFTRASGGIVYDSTPEGEYTEIMNKLAAARRAMEKFAEAKS
ncbi:MAG: anthranilate synthase component I family protein [Leptospiraceae bacterium]|nr:anthranilate synthase component I family protein [Leptospiraceae bacterium]